MKAITYYPQFEVSETINEIFNVNLRKNSYQAFKVSLSQKFKKDLNMANNN